MLRRDTRRRLDQFIANPSCRANVLSAVHDIPMLAVAEDAGLEVEMGQSPFAIGRGLVFERFLYADGAERLFAALVAAGVLPAWAAGFVDLRTRRNGGPIANMDDARALFEGMLRAFAAAPDEGRAGLPAILAAPALQIPGRAILPDGMFAVDVVTVHPAARPQKVVLRVGEIKVYPDRGGRTDAHQLATTRAQAGLYVHALRLAVEGSGVGSEVEVADDGFLVLTRPGTNTPSVRAHEDLRFQALRAERAFERLREAAALEHALPGDIRDEAISRDRLAVVRDAPKAYDERCVGFCELAERCHREAVAADSPTVLGRDVARFLGAIPLSRAAALMSGAPAQTAAEHDLVRRVLETGEGGDGVRTADVLRRIEAWRDGAPVPVGEALPWPRVEAEDRMIVAFVRMSGEARPWGVAAGRPGAEPAILAAAEPRDAGELARLALDLGRILLPHLPHPEHATEAEHAALAEVAARRQLWLPGPTHVEMLHLLDYRFSRANAREDADARDLARLGRAAGWLFRESTRPGQVRVLDATARLREAFAFPAEDVRQQHLGFLLAWLETAGPREARMEAARAAEQLSVGVTMHPSFEVEHLVPLVERWNAAREDVPSQAAVAAQIREALTPELLRRFRLAERAIAALEGSGRPANPELGTVLALGAEELTWQYWSREQKAAAPVTDPDAPRFFGDHPETDFLPTHAAARFFAHAHASEVTTAELLHGDRHLVEEAIDRGDAIEGVIVRVVNAGTKRAVIPVWTVTAPADRPLRLREESTVCVVGLRGRTGKVRAITALGDTRTVEVEIEGWKRARPDDGAPAADAKELEGTQVVLANAGVVGISKRKSMSVWDASGPGAWLTHAAPPPEPSVSPPVVGDLVDLVDALGGT